MKRSGGAVSEANPASKGIGYWRGRWFVAWDENRIP